MLIDNYHNIAAPIEAPDDSEVIAAESEYIANSIGEAMLALNDAKTAAEAERIWKAKEHVQRALDCLSDLAED